MMSKLNRKGEVFANGLLAGELIEYKDDNSAYSYEFCYSGDYIKTGYPPIGYHFPLRSEPYIRDVLHPFFQNLASEGWVRVFQATKARLDKRDDFGILLANGGDLIGAISIKPATQDAVK